NGSTPLNSCSQTVDTPARSSCWTQATASAEERRSRKPAHSPTVPVDSGTLVMAKPDHGAGWVASRPWHSDGRQEAPRSAGRDGALGALPDRVQHHRFVLGRHLVDEHHGVAVVGQLEDLGAEAPADAVAAAAVGVDLDP